MKIYYKATILALLLLICNFNAIAQKQPDYKKANTVNWDGSLLPLHDKVRKDVESRLGLLSLSLRSQLTIDAYWIRNIEGHYYLQIKALSQLTSFMFPTPDGSAKSVNFKNTPSIRAGSFTISNIVCQLVNVETNTRKTINFSLSGNWMQDKWTSAIVNTYDGGDLLYQSIPLISQKEVFEKTLKPKLSPGNPAYYYNPEKDYIKWNEWRLEIVNPGEMTMNSFPISDMENYINSEKKKIVASQTASSTTNSSSSSQNNSTTVNSKPSTSNSSKKSTSSETKDTYPTESNTIGNTGKTFEQLEYERRASERQQKEKLQQAVNPGGYAMQQSGANDFYKNEIARLNKESDLRREREEREWEADKKRRRQERIEKERRAEAYRKQQEEDQRKYNLSIEEAYLKKGGDANFNAKLKELETKIFNTIHEVNAELKRNGNNFKSFYYSDNCSYVTIIETIQKNKKLSKNRKLILIEDILALKTAYADFYVNNSKHGQDYGKNPDYQDNTTNAACSEYLRTVAKSLLMRYHGKESHNISNTNTDFVSEYKKQISPYLSQNVFDYYYKDRSGATYTRGELKFSLDNYLNFYLEKSWTFYGTNAPKSESTIWGEDRIEQVKKVKLTHELGRTYHTTKDIDELTMAVFNYNHGFFDDAFANYKVYELKIADEKTLASDVRSVTSPSVISKLLGAILYMDNKEYKQALILLTRLRKFHLPILKKIAAESKYFKEDEILEHAILKLENIIFYDVGNYKEMWLPKDKNYFKGGTSRVYNYKLLEYYNPGLLAEALYKTGNKDFAEEVIDFIVDYHKKIYKFKSTYRGTQADVDAFKRMLQIFDPKVLEKMTFLVKHKYQLFMGKEIYDYKRLLHWKFYQDYGNPLNITPIDLQNESSWIKHKENVGKLLPKEELHTVFNEQLSIYKKGKLDISDESKAFLASLVQLGVWSGNFYEVMPAMWDLKSNYDTKDYILFEELLALMTSYIGDLSYQRFDRDENGKKRWATKDYENLTIEWFVENGKKPDIKQQINDILEIWNNYDFAHVLIPFLYKL
ncbi:hypothetical protein [Yeosuana sp. AK3]